MNQQDYDDLRRMRAINHEHDISYVNANLIAIKDGPRQGGLLNI